MSLPRLTDFDVSVLAFVDYCNEALKTSLTKRDLREGQLFHQFEFTAGRRWEHVELRAEFSALKQSTARVGQTVVSLGGNATVLIGFFRVMRRARVGYVTRERPGDVETMQGLPRPSKQQTAWLRIANILSWEGSPFSAAVACSHSNFVPGLGIVNRVIDQYVDQVSNGVKHEKS